MFVVSVRFRDEEGQERLGELVNPFKIMVEPSGESVYIVQENPVDIDVITVRGSEWAMHRIPTLAVIEMREQAFA